MDNIGFILEPQGVMQWVPGVVVIGIIVTILLMVYFGFWAYNSAPKHDRTGDTIAYVFIGLMIGGVVTGLVSLGVGMFDAERMAAATVAKMEAQLGLEVLDYEAHWWQVNEFTAISEDGDAVIGRTSYEGDKIYVMSLTE